MKNRLFVFLCCVGLLIFTPSNTGAWGPFAHYTAAPQGTEWNQNLPDLWSSKKGIIGIQLPSYAGLEVSEYFGWSHACRRKGMLSAVDVDISIGPFSVTVLQAVYPKTPTEYGVPAGIEKPGEDIYYIWKNKLLAANKTVKMKKTAHGFVGHNLEDKVVHFSYFEGGSAYKWIVGHAVKEEWAEYCIYVGLGGGWDIYGNPTTPWAMGCSGDEGIINLAQKVFRKNRQTVDAVPDSTGEFKSITVETSDQIAGRISAMNSDLNTYIDDFSLAYFDFIYLVGAAAGWDATTMFTKYNAAKAAAQAGIAGMP